MRRRIIITGATGFVGAHLVRHFSEIGEEVIAIGRQSNPPVKLKAFAQYIQADIGRPMPTIKGDICIHCAGLASDTATYEDLYQVNVLGTKHVFEAVTAPIFIHISSASVYPMIRKFLKEEDAEMMEELSDYGKTKLLAEEFLEKNEHKKQQTIILRPRAIYGTHDRVLLPRILRLMKRKAIIAPGDLKIRVSLTHIDNLIHAVEQAILYELSSFNIFNITDNASYELRGVVLSLAEMIKGKEHKVHSIPIPFLRKIIQIANCLKITLPITEQALNYVTQSTLLDIEKAKKELDYQGTINFFEVNQFIADWVKSISFEKVLAAEKNLPWQ